jgi:O-antigen ligase
MGIKNEPQISGEYMSIPGIYSSQVPARHKGVSLNILCYYATFLLQFAYVYIKFFSHGAFESDDLFGYGRVLALSDLLILSFLILNSSQLRRMPPFVFLICLWLIWVLITCIGLFSYGADTAILSVLEVIYCPLLFLFFFVALRHKPELLRTTNMFFLLLLAFCLVLFFLVANYQNMLLQSSFSSLNDVYFLLLMLPWVLLYPKVLWKYVGIAIIIFAVLWSMKRTALFALVFALLTYFLSERIRARKVFDWRWMAGISLFAVISLQLYSYVDVKTNGFFLSRISSILDDRGSGRLDIYNEVIRLQSESTIDSWVLGHGHDTVRKFNTMEESEYLSAHNDWLEVLFDYGLPGLVLYSAIYFFLLYAIIHLLKRRSYIGPPLAASYALFIMISFSSHLVLYASYFAYLMAFWGSVTAFYDRDIAFYVGQSISLPQSI